MKILFSMLTAVGVLAAGVTAASAASPGYCDGYARNYANQRAGGNALGGAVTGAIGGAVLGGILGGKGGVGAGAAIGGVGGGIVGGSGWQRFYNDAYYQCINSGPAYVAPKPVYAPACPPVGYITPPDWYQQCGYKYKSFQWNGPQAGNYKGYDGCWHACQLP
jgi:hypothetical protein